MVSLLYTYSMKKEQIINNLIHEYGYTSYLEIGVGGHHTFNQIRCEQKEGTDIDQGVSSDQFFAQNERKFDLIFIDADHDHQQCEKDIINALNCLNENGVIVMHDVNPETLAMQAVPRTQRVWTGDVWRCFVGYPGKKECYLSDYGVGVLYPVEVEAGFSSTMDALEFMANKELFLLKTEDVEPEIKKPKRKKKKANSDSV